MKTVDQQLIDYIEDQEHYEYLFPNGIMVSVQDQNFLEAECTLVDVADARLSISFYCEQKEFVQRLAITSLQDLYDLTPGNLMEMYYEGLAEMVCFVAIAYTYCMSFQRLGNRIVAENERGFKHTIPLFERLETPDQFMAYTKRYYRLMECFEN